jgi:hypothetical protein
LEWLFSERIRLALKQTIFVLMSFAAIGALTRPGLDDLISNVLPFGKLYYREPNAISNAVGYAKFLSRMGCDSRLRRSWQCD